LGPGCCRQIRSKSRIARSRAERLITVDSGRWWHQEQAFRE
jgi:hypothetical protein